MCVFIQGSLPPLFVFAEMDNKPHTQHFAIKFDVTAKVSAVRGSEPEVFFFLSSFCLNHAFSLKFNYQSSNFLFLYARSTFLAPSKQSATHTHREQNPQTQLTVRSHRSPQHLCTLRRLRTCSCRPHPTSNTSGSTTQLRSFRPSFLPCVQPGQSCDSSGASRAGSAGQAAPGLVFELKGRFARQSGRLVMCRCPKCAT